MQYLLGSLSKMFGLTKNAIRHYEKMGLVASLRDPANRYRYYDISATASLCKLRSFRAAGFSLDEIKNIFDQRTIPDVNSIIKAKHDELYLQIEMIKSQVLNTEHMLEIIKKLEGELPSCRVQSRPHMFFLPNINNNERNRAHVETVRAWIERMPYVRISHIIRFSNGVAVNENGFCADKASVDKFALPIDRWVREFPPCDCVRYLYSFTMRQRNQFCREWFEALFAFMKLEGYKMPEDGLSHGLWTLGNDQDTIYFNEMWIPIIK